MLNTFDIFCLEVNKMMCLNLTLGEISRVAQVVNARQEKHYLVPWGCEKDASRCLSWAFYARVVDNDKRRREKAF